jgi:hypothetical protein
MPAYIRSFLTTAAATFLSLIPVAAVLEGDFTWAGAAVTSAVVAALRTLLAALDPQMPLFGVVSEDTGDH